MSNLTVRPARRSEAKPLIAFYDKSGGGKTLSALFLARGFVGRNGKIVMIESEAGRGEAHMDTVIGDSYVGGFDVISLREDFSPKTYSEAITLAERADAQALIVDSFSHEWEGVGGVLHMAEMKRQEGTKGQQVWTQAKIDHQRHVIGRLLQTPIPLVILCMRAKIPMEEYLDDKGKKQLRRSDMLVPKQDHDILFECFVHGHFDAEHKFHGTKYTKPELANVLRSGEVITNATGEALARWARNEPTATLGAIIARIAHALDLNELSAVGLAARGLPEGDKAAAGAAYKQRMQELTTAKAPPTEEPKGE
jgi:hypothetical protein